MKHSKINAGLLSLCFFSQAICAYEVPDLGNATLNQKTQPVWQQLSAGFIREVRDSKERLKDPISESYLENLTHRLLPHDTDTSLYIINSPSINAFAGPGDVIVMHSGLFAHTEDENELAAVLAHELSHQQQHHMWRRMQREKEIQVPVALGTMLAIALGAWNPALGQTALSAGATLLEDTELKYSRAFEQEADRMGIGLLAKTGFDPNSMAGFFSKLGAHERYTTQSSIPEILRTHPVTDSRIADATNHASHFAKQHPTSSLDFLLVQARLHVLSTPFQQSEIENYRKKESLSLADKYGYALALFNTQHTTTAIAQMETLQKEHPDNLILGLSLASFYSVTKNDEKANNLLEQIYLKNPQQKSVLMAYSHALFDQGHYDKVIQLLAHVPLPAEGHELLAETYGKQKKLDEAYYHQAKAMEMLAFKAQAKIYYEKAKKQSKDGMLIAMIEHDLRVI